jgi:hypothetical protein
MSNDQTKRAMRVRQLQIALVTAHIAVKVWDAAGLALGTGGKESDGIREIGSKIDDVLLEFSRLQMELGTVEPPRYANALIQLGHLDIWNRS